MKKTLLSLMLMLPLAAFAQTTNLIENGDFESVDNWDFDPNVDTNQAYIEASSYPGNTSLMYLQLKLEGRHTVSYFNTEDDSEDTRNVIPLEAGKKYKLSFWAKASAETDMMAGFTFIQKATKAKKGEEWPQFVLPGNNEWKQYSTEITCPAEADRAAFELYFTYAIATVCFDDIVLTEVGTEAPTEPQGGSNIFSFGGFEENFFGRLKGWYLGTTDHTLITEGLPEGVKGEYALKMYPKSGNTTLLMTMNAGEPNSITVEPGKTYELTFWAKADAADEKMSLYFTHYTNGVTDNEKHFVKEDFMPTTAWQKYTFPVVMDEETNSLSFTIDFKTSNGYVYFDEFELHKVESPSAIALPTAGVAYQATAEGLEVQLESPQTIAVYGVGGRLVQRQTLAAGCHSFELPAGFYVVKTQQGSFKVNINRF